MLLLFFKRGRPFSCKRRLSISFFFFNSSKLFLYFFFLLVVINDRTLLVFSPFTERLQSSVGLLLVDTRGGRGVGRAAVALRVSSFQFFLITGKREKKNLTERWRRGCSSLCLSPLLCSFLFLSLKKESPDGCKAKNHKYWVPSFGEF